LQLAVQRGTFIGECPMFPKNLLMGQSIWSLQKRKNNSESTHGGDRDFLFFALFPTGSLVQVSIENVYHVLINSHCL
jgi:hypothetical protein